MGWVDYVFVSAFVAMVYWGERRSHKRTTEMRTLADSCGLRFLGKTLPDSISQGQLPGAMTSTWNIVEGRGNFVVFDSRFGRSKGGWTRTAIAVNESSEAERIASFDPEMTTERIGSWTFFFYPRRGWNKNGLTPISVVRSYIDVLCRDSERH